MLKSLDTLILYTTDVHQKHFSVAIVSISFFSSFDMKKFYHILGCHAIGINSFFFFKCFAFFKFTTSSQTSELNNSISIIIIKIIIFIKVNFIKIYIKNMSFISIKCDFIINLIKNKYITISQ